MMEIIREILYWDKKLDDREKKNRKMMEKVL